MTTHRIRTLVVLLIGGSLGAIGHAALSPSVQRAVAQPGGDPVVTSEREGELEAIRDRLPDQSHAMQDVGYHFSNLWFAGKDENWELANFYWSETRSHLRWAVRIIPVRKDNAGTEIKLEEILEAMENSPLRQLEQAIAARDGAAFEKAYRFTVEGCYSCHKASDKPFIRLQIPTQPAATIINSDPNATWPR